MEVDIITESLENLRGPLFIIVAIAWLVAIWIIAYFSMLFVAYVTLILTHFVVPQLVEIVFSICFSVITVGRSIAWILQ